MSNLLEQLIKADAKKADELEKTTFKSKKLAKILESVEPVEITLQEISPKRQNEIVGMAIDKKGNYDFTKSYDANALLCVEGIIEPDVKNSDLAEHFNCRTPKELVIKLFGNEVNEISAVLANINKVENVETEIKN